MEEPTKVKRDNGNTTSAIYVLGIVGAAIYFIGKATTFWAGVVGFLKALVWPVILVYEALGHFEA